MIRTNEMKSESVYRGKSGWAILVAMVLALSLSACGGGSGGNGGSGMMPDPGGENTGSGTGGGGGTDDSSGGDGDMNPDSDGTGNGDDAGDNTGNVEPTLYFSNSLGTSGLAGDGTYPTTQTRVVFTDVSGTGKNGPLASDQDNTPQLTISWDGNTVEFTGNEWDGGTYKEQSGSFTAYGWWASDGDHVDVAAISTERKRADGEVYEAVNAYILHGTATPTDFRPKGMATYSKESGFRAAERASYTTWDDFRDGTPSDGPNYRGDVSVSFDFANMDYDGTISNIRATGKFRNQDSTPTNIGNITFGSSITGDGFSADGAEITWAGRENFHGSIQGTFFGPNGEEIGAVFNGTNGSNQVFGHMTAEKE